jgi:cellulose synthase/poly-beta-1,6-N-acetylglucosamine synthase-like glycosyltransferase/peptidoglycan/xylan/chitin deacetylase (PgdA/CDA1 family)
VRGGPPVGPRELLVVPFRRRLRRAGRGGPPAHRAVLALCVGGLVLLLVVQGISTRTIGASGTPGAAVSRATPLAGVRPVLAANGDRLRSSQPVPGHRIALTFDDGPSPTWTPRLARVLRRAHVPATFFVVGSQVARYPGVVRMLHREGFELGNHTFTHADLSTLPGWEASEQVSLTESALAGTVGIRARLLRPPYAATPAAVTPRQDRTLAGIARRGGYLIVLADYDPRDWSAPGVGSIVHDATPPTQAGGIVLMHDGGGNRSETVKAVERLIPRLRARGFQFVTVSSLADLPRRVVEVPAGSWQSIRGAVFVTALSLSRAVASVLTTLVALVGVLVALRMLIVLLLAHRHARRREDEFDRGFAPPVSMVVPAYNEVVGIGAAVRSLVRSDYPDFEVIVVDDGSEDGTSERVDALGLASVRLLRQPNRGKAAALNRGIAAARHDLIVTVDADTVFEDGTLRRLVQPFRDPGVGAVSGNTKIGNRRCLLGRWQHVEYVIGFNLDRRFYEVLECMPTVPGAIGAFRRAALDRSGGVSGATLAEDTDVTMGIGRAGWHVVYAHAARAWTEAPSTLAGLWRQRYRWAYGTMQAVWKHRGAVRRRGDRIGRRAIPYLVLFQVLLPLTAPLVDLFALYGVLFLDPLPVLAYWAAFNALQLGLGAYAFRLDGEPMRALAWLPLQQFVYRQIMYLVVIESVLSAAAGTRLRWHKLERTGDVEIESGRARS